MAPVSRLARLKKRTTGRVIMSAAGSLLRLLALISPDRADELAAELFARPSSGGRKREPEVPGLAGHRFELTLANRRIAAWDWGEGPSVLLAHGWDGYAAQLSSFVEPLVNAGFHVLAFDQPAHGQSSGSSATAIDFADALTAIARRLTRVHAVVGHSLGATSTALALSRGLEVDRVALIAPAAAVTPFALQLARALRLPPARQQGMLAALGRRVHTDLAELDLVRLAPTLRTPALILHDPDDQQVAFAHGRDISAAWPGARLVPLAGLGHFRPLRDREVVRKVVEFVSESRRAMAKSA